MPDKIVPVLLFLLIFSIAGKSFSQPAANEQLPAPVIELGGLYKSGKVQNRPLRPWQLDDGLHQATSYEYGDIADFTTLPDMNQWVIGDTPERPEQRLRWHKIVDGGKTVLVCDRVILARVSWQDLQSQGWVEGKEIQIDGRTYRCRLLSGGSRARSETEGGRLGGFPENNEWDRWITDEANIPGLPIPTPQDVDFVSDDSLSPRLDTHNHWWNWRLIWSWCAEPHAITPRWSVKRGSISARAWSFEQTNARQGDTGWRPVLEEID